MWPQILLLVGLTSTVNLGERSPGLAALVDVRPGPAVIRLVADTTDKTSGPGWRGAASLDITVWRGLRVGGEVGYRDGGPWQKSTTWARLGWQAGHFTVTGRLRVAGNPPASGAVAWAYTRPFGRLALGCEQGLLIYRQPDARWGLYSTVTAGVRLGKAAGRPVQTRSPVPAT